MNKLFITAAGALIGIAGFATPAIAANVGVSIDVGQPGFYGRINIGDVPRPRIIYAEPRIVERVEVYQEPIYLHVRPGHARRWNRYCHEYNACGQRVYFVNDNWYNTVYVDHYREHGRHNHEGYHGDHRRDDGHGDRHHDHDRNRRNKKNRNRDDRDHDD